jgi:hypothetical protein
VKIVDLYNFRKVVGSLSDNDSIYLFQVRNYHPCCGARYPTQTAGSGVRKSCSFGSSINGSKNGSKNNSSHNLADSGTLLSNAASPSISRDETRSQNDTENEGSVKGSGRGSGRSSGRGSGSDEYDENGLKTEDNVATISLPSSSSSSPIVRDGKSTSTDGKNSKLRHLPNIVQKSKTPNNILKSEKNESELPPRKNGESEKEREKEGKNEADKSEVEIDSRDSNSETETEVQKSVKTILSVRAYLLFTNCRVFDDEPSPVPPFPHSPSPSPQLLLLPILLSNSFLLPTRFIFLPLTYPFLLSPLLSSRR